MCVCMVRIYVLRMHLNRGTYLLHANILMYHCICSVTASNMQTAHFTLNPQGLGVTVLGWLEGD